MKPKTNQIGRRHSQISIEFFENIPSTYSLMNKLKIEDHSIGNKTALLQSTKSEQRSFVPIQLGATDHVQSHRNLFEKIIMKSPQQVEKRGYGSSHHFHKLLKDSEIFNSQSIYTIQQNQSEERPSHHFNVQNRQIPKSPHQQQLQEKEKQRTATHQAGKRTLQQNSYVYGNQQINQDSKYDYSTISQKTHGIKDSQNNTWTRLPNYFFESKTDKSTNQELQSINQIISKKQRNKADLTIAQINKAVVSVENNQLNNFNEAISALTSLQRGFERLPQIETLIKSLVSTFTREQNRLTLQLEIISNQNKVKVQEYQRMIHEAQEETKLAKLKLIDEENFRTELMKPEMQEQIKKQFKEWTSLADLGYQKAPDFVHDTYFSGVSDPLEAIVTMNLSQEGQQAQVLSLTQKDFKISEIIDRQQISLHQIQNDQNKLLKEVQQQTALTVLKRFYRHIVPREKSIQTEPDAIQVIKNDFYEKSKTVESEINRFQIREQGLKQDQELLQGQIANVMIQKREKMVIITKLERDIIEMKDKMSHLQYQLDNQEGKQQFRISKIEEQAKEITRLTNEVANLKTYIEEVENQVRAKLMQIQHLYGESSKQTEQIEKLEEENQKLTKQLDETNVKLRCALSDLRNQVQAENRPMIQELVSKRTDTIVNGKDYGHLLDKNILNDVEFKNFLVMLKDDEKIEFEADALEAAQRRIDSWFKTDSTSAEASTLTSIQTLRQRIELKRTETLRMLKGRRGGIRLETIAQIQQKRLSSQESKYSSNSSISDQEQEKPKKSQISQPRKSTIKRNHMIKQEQLSGEIKVKEEIKVQTQLETQKTPWQRPIEQKEKETIDQIKNNRIVVTQKHVSVQTDSELQTQKTDDKTTDLNLNPKTFERRKTIKDISSNNLIKNEASNTQQSTDQQQIPRKIVARNSLTVVVQGKCQSCLSKLTENEKLESAQAYETILKLQAILSEKRKSTVFGQIILDVKSRLQSIEAKHQDKLIDVKSTKQQNLPKNAKTHFKSPQHQFVAESQQTSIISRMGPQFSNHLKKTTTIDTPKTNPLLEYEALLNQSGVQTPYYLKPYHRIEQGTQTETTVYDRENLLALQLYLGKRIVYLQSDVYTNLQAKMRHPDVPFVGSKLTPVLGNKSYQSASCVNLM